MWLARIILCFVLSFTIGIVVRAEDPVKVGMLVPLSGPLAQFGQAMQNGVNLASEDTQSFAGKLTFIFEDSHYDVAKSVAGFRKLATINKTDVNFVFGGPPSESAVSRPIVL